MTAPTISLADAVHVIKTLGVPPIGSPAMVREHAAGLRRTADALDSGAGLLGSCANVDGYLGPAARRHHADASHEAHMLRTRLERLRALAARLEREANDLEHRQRAWRSSFAGKAVGLPGGLGHQALSHLGWKLP
jgi:hypothetical protein